jgi:hypothetical protein
MRGIPFVLLLSLAACEEANQPTADAIPALVLQSIGYPDIEANNLFGASCAYASGKSMAPLVIAFADEAVMKIDGKIKRFQADSESEIVELGTRTRYVARNHTLRLTIDGAGKQGGGETVNFTGTLRLLDDRGGELFAAEGAVQCGN